MSNKSKRRNAERLNRGLRKKLLSNGLECWGAILDEHRYHLAKLYMGYSYD